MPLARYLDGYLARIAPAAHRLRNVTLECRDALEVIGAYQRPGCLIYLEPPVPRRHPARRAVRRGVPHHPRP